jgi:polysaccharide export outer membrane protein
MWFEMRFAIIIPLAAILLASCHGAPPTLAPDGDSDPVVENGPPDLGAFTKRPESLDYPLYPGDRIRIEVQGHEDLTVEREIPPDGHVPLYGVDVPGPDGNPVPTVVKAAGKRVPDLEEELKRIYSKIVNPPYVTVTVTSYVEKVIYVVGAVSASGRFVLPNQRRISLLKALATAGWFTETAARDRVQVIREDPITGEPIMLPPIDVTAIMAGERTDLDLILEPGDTITVDDREGQSVFIFGHVESPGEYAYRRGMTLTNLVTLAGGFRTFAKYSNIRVMRGGGTDKARTYGVDMDEILDGEAPDFRLSPGDRVYVDERFI